MALKGTMTVSDGHTEYSQFTTPFTSLISTAAHDNPGTEEVT